MKKINQLKQYLLERNLLNNSTAGTHQFTIKTASLSPSQSTIRDSNTISH